MSSRTVYTDSLREQALEKAFNRGDASVTPAQRHSGQDQAILAKRHAVYIEPKDATHNAGADAHETGRTYTKFISILKKQPNHKARLWH